MYNPKIGKFKEGVVAYINSITESEEPIDTLDIFVYDGNRSLRLTHFGYRNLKDHYEFFEMEFTLELNVKHASALDRLMEAPYYYKHNSRSGICKLFTADKMFMKKLKLSQYQLLTLLE